MKAHTLSRVAGQPIVTFPLPDQRASTDP